MAVQTNQVCSAENGLAYILEDYQDTGPQANLAFQVRYANTSGRPVTFIVRTWDGVELFRQTVPGTTPETTLAIPTGRRYDVFGAQRPLANCAS